MWCLLFFFFVILCVSQQNQAFEEQKGGKSFLFYVDTKALTPEKSHLKRYSLEDKIIEDVFEFPEGMYVSHLSSDCAYISSDNVLFLKLINNGGKSQFYGIDLEDGKVKFYDDQWSYLINPYRFFNTSKQGKDELCSAETRTEYKYMKMFYNSRNLSKPNYQWSSHGDIGEKGYQVELDRSSTVFNEKNNTLYIQIKRIYEGEFYIIGIDVLKWEKEQTKLLHVKDHPEGRDGCSLSSINYDPDSDQYYSVLQTNSSYNYEFGVVDPKKGEFTKISEITTDYFWPRAGSTIAEGKYYQYIQRKKDNSQVVIVIDLDTGRIEEDLVLADSEKQHYLSNLIYFKFEE